MRCLLFVGENIQKLLYYTFTILDRRFVFEQRLRDSVIETEVPNLDPLAVPTGHALATLIDLPRRHQLLETRNSGILHFVEALGGVAPDGVLLGQAALSDHLVIIVIGPESVHNLLLAPGLPPFSELLEAVFL